MKLYRTYIKGWDEELRGGIPQGHITLIAGPPGTMKSSLAYYVLYHQAKRNDVKGIYITLEQSRRSLEFQMARLGMDPKEVIGRLRIQDLSKIRKGVEATKGVPKSDSDVERPWLEVLKKLLEDMKETTNYELLVVDSLPILEIISGIKENRIRLFHFFEWLRDLDVTTFIINETGVEMKEVCDEDFLADGLIHVLMEKVGEIDVYRRIRCVKMRGVDHNTGYFTLEFKEGAFQVSQVI